MNNNKVLKYRVFDKNTNEDITEKYDWVIRPNGSLYFLEYSDLIGYENAYCIFDFNKEE